MVKTQSGTNAEDLFLSIGYTPSFLSEIYGFFVKTYDFAGIL